MAQATLLENEPDAGITSSPPYVSFQTVVNCLDWLATEGIPHRFDRSFWSRKYSGSIGPQLLTALRFLGLLSGDEPQPILEKLVASNTEERKQMLGQVLRESYREVDFDRLSRATPAMLREWLAKYRIQGTTLRKAEGFLINALKYVGFPISGTLAKTVRSSPAGNTSSPRMSTKRKPTPNGPKPASDMPLPSEPLAHRQSATVEEVELDSGGKVIVTLHVNLFRLSERDREFVLGLVELVDAFRIGTEDEHDPVEEYEEEV